MIFVLLRLCLIFVVLGLVLWAAWRILRTIPEVRVLLKLDDIKSTEKLAKTFANVDETKHESEKESINKFISKKEKK